MSRALGRFAGLGALAVVMAALILAGCGTAAAPQPGPKVTLTLSGPADESRVSAAFTTVRGTVKPARAQVQVLGREVAVSAAGSFSLRVALGTGTNLIDVEASLPRSAGAAAAVRVIRFLLVTVPDVSGESPAQATASLQALGLTVKTDSSSDPLNFLIPAATELCSITPLTGAKVDPGATVTLHTSKICGF